jgi:CAAX prenyl protease-like protein
VTSPYLRYLFPFGVFLALSFLQGLAPAGEDYWLAYGAKIVLAALALAICFRGHWREIEGAFDWRAVAVGLGMLALWLVNYYVAYNAHGESAFNPSFLPLAQKTLFLGMRLLGAALVIPIIEELFFRSFLMRYFIDSNFLGVSLGSYTAFSFWFTALVFAAMHPMWQWGAALAAGAAYGYYLVKTKNLIGCIIAHGTTNLGLGIYIIVMQKWELWM